MSKHISLASYELETAARAEGYAHVCGADEAGTGPLMGPVYAAAVILPPHCAIPGLNDSKKLTDKRRRELFPLRSQFAILNCSYWNRINTASDRCNAGCVRNLSDGEIRPIHTGRKRKRSWECRWSSKILRRRNPCYKRVSCKQIWPHGWSTWMICHRNRLSNILCHDTAVRIRENKAVSHRNIMLIRRCKRIRCSAEEHRNQRHC